MIFNDTLRVWETIRSLQWYCMIVLRAVQCWDVLPLRSATWGCKCFCLDLEISWVMPPCPHISVLPFLKFTKSLFARHCAAQGPGPERWTYLSWKETKCLCRSDCHAVSCCADCQRFVGTMVVKVAIDESSGSWLADCLFSFCHPIGGDVWLKLTAKHRTSRLTWQGPQIKCRANVDINDWFSNTYNIYRYTQSITV